MLCLLERPSQPVNFNVTSEDDTSLTLTWNEPVNTTAEVNYYIVSITLFNGRLYLLLLHAYNYVDLLQ